MADQPFHQKEQKGRRSKDEKPFLMDLDLAALDHGRIGLLFDAVKIEQIQIEIAGHGSHIFAAGHRSHFLQA